MNWTKTIIVTGLAIVSTFAVGRAIKEEAFSPVKDAYFQPDTDALRLVPGGIVALRTTHFARSMSKIRHYHEGETLARTVGRNASLRDLIAEAYDCDPARVVLPPHAPKDHFDFVVTTPSKVRAHLRDAIANKLLLTAHSENRDMDVLVLKAADSNLPGLRPNDSADDANVNYRDGRLYFKHEPVAVIVRGLQDGLNAPIVDQTGLTNCYDFSIAWNDRVTKKMNRGEFNLDGVNQVLNSMGLGLESENLAVDACVVTKAH